MNRHAAASLVLLLAVPRCDFPDRLLRLSAGERCQDGDECISGSCQQNSEDDTKNKICCSIECPGGSWCHPSGSHCIGCQGPACLEGCGDTDCELGLGSHCMEDMQCRSGTCDADISGVLRCCDSVCAEEQRGCHPAGGCECPLGERWNGVGCEPIGEAASSASTIGDLFSAGEDGTVSPSIDDGAAAHAATDDLVAGGDSGAAEPLLGTCGDGGPGVKEECDPPTVGTCTMDCQLIVCGDGVIEGDEECEPPQTVTCDEECRLISCGNGDGCQR